MIRWFTIRRPEQIAALASPVRQEILDALAGMPGSSVADLADALGRPPDSLYYHVRALVRVGLIVAGGGDRGRRGALYRTIAPHLRLAYDPSSPVNASLVGRAVASMMRLAARDFRRGFRLGVAVSGSRRELWAGRSSGWLSGADLARVNSLLTRLSALLQSSRRRPGSRFAAVTFTLVPLEPRPRRKEGPHVRRS